MAKTEALGEGLLNEAYRCLGTDVDEWIEAYKSSKTEQEQIKVIEWLHTRLREMTDRSGEEDEAIFYHPARLSPKMIGTYPDHNVRPTCLSVSIIGASFLHQAGAEVLHAGVMQTYKERQAMEATMFLAELPGLGYEHYGVKLSPPVISSIKERGRSALKQVHQDRGYHAAVMTRLMNGEWVQVDPNFDASTIIGDESTAALDSALDELTKLHDVAPGLERTILTRLGTISDLARLLLEDGGRGLIAAPETIKAILTDPWEESIPQRIKEACVDPFYKAKRDDHPSLNEIWFHYTNAERPSGARESALAEGSYAMFEKYVLQSEPITDVLKRCREDEAYLQRRIEDAQALPLTVLAWHVLQGMRYFPQVPNHVIFEVGLPAMRIGSAVMNDFASYCDDQLLPSYRLSHWSSHIPITEVIPDTLKSDVQAQVVENNAHWLRTGLRYSKDYGIITPFLVNREQRRAEARNDEGNQDA
jgi:hypothetical protein